MNRNIKSLIGFDLKETDGDIGKVVDFYFDDKSWTVRYAIVKTGNWLSEKKVLISPQAFKEPDWENEEFPVNLTQEQIKNSPDIDTEKPVSRQQEEQLSNYYPWEGYWDEAHDAAIFGQMPSDLYYEDVTPPVPTAAETDIYAQENNDQHLHSTEDVDGYNIHAIDGEIGKVVDYIVDDANWKLKYFVVETGSWLNSKKVLLSTRWIKEVNWENSTVIVNISTEAVKNSPEFDVTQPVKEAAERMLFTYYGKPIDE
jgi:uncharacterized protein YrrD